MSATPVAVLYRSGMRMCTRFGYNCYIIFCHFFHFVNLVIFRPQFLDSGYLVSATPHTMLYRSFWNFAHVFSMVWMVHVVWINLCITSCYFFHFVTFVVFWPQILWKCIDGGYLFSATFLTILCRYVWNFALVLSMVWRCAWDLNIILELSFVFYSTLWTLSFSDIRFYESE